MKMKTNGYGWNGTQKALTLETMRALKFTVDQIRKGLSAETVTNQVQTLYGYTVYLNTIEALKRNRNLFTTNRSELVEE